MQTLFHILKKRFATAAIFLIAVFAVSCSGNGNSAANRQLDETKQKTTQSLSKIKIDVESRIAYVDQELETATGEIREKLSEARAELESQKEIIETELDKITKATLESWNDVVKQASESTAKAKTKTNEVSKNVRAMLDGQ
jgi:DNA anti-recombination protein RmuC